MGRAQLLDYLNYLNYLGKDHTYMYSIENIRLPDGRSCDNTEEALKYLLDTHFPSNKSQIPKDKNRKHQPSYEDLEIADKIVTEERVRWAISLFAPLKSPGIDNIYPALIQKGMDIILQLIIKIFRACIALGYIPISWRTSRVVFVPKPGRADYTMVKAFRPISLMSFLLKTLERLVDRFRRHFDKVSAQ